MQLPDWLNRRSDRLSGRKGELVEQDRYEFPFVILQKVGNKRWVINIWSHPEMKGKVPSVPIPFTGKAKDAIRAARLRNDEMTDTYLRRQRRRALAAQKGHDELARRHDNKHRIGPILECPVCNPRGGRS